jgi:hypothetical protein
VKITGLCKAGHHAQCTGTLHRLAGGGPCGCSCHAGEWTAQRVKDELPEVPVKLDCGLIAQGKVSGRLNQFATVTFASYGRLEFAWQTIADCLNRGVPLRV